MAISALTMTVDVGDEYTRTPMLEGKIEYIDIPSVLGRPTAISRKTKLFLILRTILNIYRNTISKSSPRMAD